MLSSMICRNMKLYFKDKGAFITSLITPMILLVLYATFLGKIYTDSFNDAVPQGFTLSSGLIEATVGAQLLSSILAVSCITVAFSTNMLMVRDKANGSLQDLMIAPVKNSVLSLSYYIASVISTLIVCFGALGACLAYIASVGWFMSSMDVLMLCVDIVVSVLFGTALSSVINVFLSTQGQISAVSTIISAGYGFICGAYMPVASFGEGLQQVLSFLPSTYSTALFRGHALHGVLEQMKLDGMPEDVVNEIGKSLDVTKEFFGNNVPVSAMLLIVGGASVLLIITYVVLNMAKEKMSR